MTDKPDKPMVSYALCYAKQGWPVFPCNPKQGGTAKRPLVAGNDKDKDGKPIPKTGGFHRATTDEKQIRAWWRKHPDALIGCPMGQRTGVFVIDLDPRDEDVKAVHDRLVAAVGDLPDGPVVITQSGGMHLYFRLPKGKKTLPANSAKRLHNVDWRGEGGYVILPPSRMSDGNTYDWQELPDYGADERGATGLLNAPEPPPKLLDLVYQRGDFAKRAKATAPAQDAKAIVHDLREGDKRVRAYCQKVLDEAAAAVAKAAKGERNHTLNAKAFLLAPYVKLQLLTEREVTARLQDAADASGLTAEDGDESRDKTIRSGLSADNPKIGDVKKKMEKIRREAEASPKRARKRGGGDPGAPGTIGPMVKPLPPDCPVHALGCEGENYYFIDDQGQLFETGDKQLGQDRIRRLFGLSIDYLYANWPRINFKTGTVEGWRAERVAESLYVSAKRKGIWNAFDKVRGRGAWLGKKGELIIHSGAHLMVNGRRFAAGCEIDGYFYPSLPAIAGPQSASVKVADNPARILYEAFQTWTWERPKVDPFLLLGWIAAALLGGALPWRPSMFIIGDKGTGKSTLQWLIKQLFMGGVISTPETTAAGIYQQVKHDSLPIAVDELEADVDPRRAMAVVKLARLAASGGVMLRGGQDHTGVQFQARSCFLFSAINPPPMTAQDWSRLAVLSVGKLDRAKTERGPEIKAIDEIAPKLLRILLDNWSRFDATFEAYRTALRAGGHDSRGQDTYGTFLACADLLLGADHMDELGVDDEDLSFWTDALSAAALPEIADENDNWQKCIHHLLSQRVEAWRGGQRSTVGGLLQEYQREELELKYVNINLASAGLRLLPKNNGIRDDSLILCDPNSGPDVGALFKETVWQSAVWASALRQGPGTVVVTDKAHNRHRINGFPRRCSLILLKALEEHGAEGEVGDTLAG